MHIFGILSEYFRNTGYDLCIFSAYFLHILHILITSIPKYGLCNTSITYLHIFGIFLEYFWNIFGILDMTFAYFQHILHILNTSIPNMDSVILVFHNCIFSEYFLHILFCSNQNMQNIYGKIRTHCVSFNRKLPGCDRLGSPRGGGASARRAAASGPTDRILSQGVDSLEPQGPSGPIDD